MLVARIHAQGKPTGVGGGPGGKRPGAVGRRHVPLPSPWAGVAVRPRRRGFVGAAVGVGKKKFSSLATSDSPTRLTTRVAAVSTRFSSLVMLSASPRKAPTP